jgi:hypothetical protein
LGFTLQASSRLYISRTILLEKCVWIELSSVFAQAHGMRHDQRHDVHVLDLA